MEALLCEPFYEPPSWNAMMQCDDKDLWLEAAKSEYNSLMNQKTWKLVPRPTDKPVIKSRWLFKLKLNSDGQISRYKARFVAKGLTQTFGVDYFDTFSPVVKMDTLRFLIAIAVKENLDIVHMDVDTAFLYGVLKEEIYMEQPVGFSQEPRKLVCKLLKSIYGLKQASRTWNIHFTSILKTAGFTPSNMDPCLFTCTTGNVFAAIAIYVDDCILVGNKAGITKLKETLHQNFSMKDLGSLEHILGIKVCCSSNSIALCQSTYIDKMLERFSFDDCKPVSIPILNWLSKPIDDSDNPFDVQTYQQAIGSLNFLAVCTRPDISFTVGQLAQHMVTPHLSHWNAVCYLFRYISGTKHLSLTYTSDGVASFYFDASFANEINCKSTSGYCCLVLGGAISWRSKKQSIVANSTMESEYIALHELAKHVMWLKKLEFHDLQKPTLFVDNQSCIKTACNPIIQDCSKHIAVRYHYICDLVNTGQVLVKYCPNSNMVADILTKPLQKQLLQRFVMVLV